MFERAREAAAFRRGNYIFTQMMLLAVLAVFAERATGDDGPAFAITYAILFAVIFAETGLVITPCSIIAWKIPCAGRAKSIEDCVAEPVGATLIAWLLPAIAEVPSARTLFGGGAILIGIVLGLWPSAPAKAADPRVEGS